MARRKKSCAHPGCRVTARIRESGYCFSHDPELAEVLEDGRARGGGPRKLPKVKAPRDLTEARAFLAKVAALAAQYRKYDSVARLMGKWIDADKLIRAGDPSIKTVDDYLTMSEEELNRAIAADN